jgi:hypothetical protein
VRRWNLEPKPVLAWVLGPLQLSSCEVSRPLSLRLSLSLSLSLSRGECSEIRREHIRTCSASE